MYSARSASDNTDDWPFWMVWDGKINVTIQAIESATGERVVAMPFVSRKQAEWLARELTDDSRR